jgi:hypothetical protein
MKNNTITDMAKHAMIIGGVAFVYMGLFGHGLPTQLRGPLGKKLALPKKQTKRVKAGK